MSLHFLKPVDVCGINQITGRRVSLKKSLILSVIVVGHFKAQMFNSLLFNRIFDFLIVKVKKKLFRNAR
jgi:hypothetical protein